jgi:16S rRNA (adenine1518-N6/adenine1519-N6)-dimethyltransferase
MSLLSEIKSFCSAYNISPRRERGQNFLITPLVYKQIIEAADIQKDDIALEIGPGLGYLTQGLAEKAKKVVAVEIDKNLTEILEKRLRDYKNIKIIHGDALKLQVASYKLQDYKLVANLPYNITGAILRKFLSSEQKPKTLVLMLQKEVAQRIVSRAPRASLLSLMVQFYGQPKIVKLVSKNNFWPKPKVDSAIIKIDRVNKREKINEEEFFKLLRAGFCSPRKYLISNLIRQNIFLREDAGIIWQKLEFNPKIRAQELFLEQWIKLFKFL